MCPSEKRPITAEDLYAIQLITECEISPDGQQIVYVLQEVDRETEKKYSHLWSVPALGGKPNQLTVGKQLDFSPKWSPDGQWVAFISNRNDPKQPQLFILPVAGGEARPVTDIKGDLGQFNWSPDSQKIVFQFRAYDPEDVEMAKDEKKKELGRVSRRVTNRVFFKLDGYGYLPTARYHLWTVDIVTCEAKQLTDSELYDENAPVWSPDGKAIAFLSNRTEQPDLNPDRDDLYLYDLEKEDFQQIEAPIGPKGSLSFSPDGSKIAYLGYEGTKNGYKNAELWIVELNSPHSARSLTTKLDINVGGGVINDVGGVATVPPVWSKDGQKLYFQVGRHGRTSLHSVGLDGEMFDTLIEFDGAVINFSLDATQDKLAFTQGTMTDPCQVAVMDMASGDIQILTEVNQALFDQLDLGSFEEVWFKGAGENHLQGWILKPPHFDPARQYPSILEIHGGPQAQYGFFFMHEFFYLAAQGYVVYFCNPRGGQGYGEAHTKAIYYGKWGTVDYDDLMVWADYVEKLPYIDPQNMGVTGGSYGGYMTAWIIGHTERFKAAAAQRSVSNLVSMWGSSDFNWTFQTIFDDKAPYENLDVLWQCSPMKHLGAAKTPTLIIHSLQDLRCPIEQSEQLYVGLKNLGVDTEFLMFPDSPHGVSRTGRTDRKIVRLEGILDWFERYLKK